MNERKVLTVYAIDERGERFRVAGYEEKTALQAVKDPTIKHICKAAKLIAVNKNGETVATSED